MTTAATIYNRWKPTVMGRYVDIDRAYGAQCVDVFLDYATACFPGVSWPKLVPPVPSAKLLFSHANEQYWQKIVNKHSDASQLPQKGDVLIFDETPQAGYSNKFDNPDGHVGICERATRAGYWLLQQNAPALGAATNVTYYPWRYRPCIGWLRPKLAAPTVPKRAPKPAPKGRSIFLPSSVLKWRVYRVSGPWTPGHEVAYLWPSKFPPGLTYAVQKQLAPHMYQIKTQDFGTVAIYVGPDTDGVIK